MIPAVIERCAGLDVGKKFLAVCVMTGPAREEAKAEVRKVRHNPQSTGGAPQVAPVRRLYARRDGEYGVYWRPGLNILEDDPEYSLKGRSGESPAGQSGHRT